MNFYLDISLCMYVIAISATKSGAISLIWEKKESGIWGIYENMEKFITYSTRYINLQVYPVKSQCQKLAPKICSETYMFGLIWKHMFGLRNELLCTKPSLGKKKIIILETCFKLFIQLVFQI